MRLRHLSITVLILGMLAAGCNSGRPPAAEKKLPVRVVVVTTWQSGSPTGGTGELTAWAKETPVTFRFPAGQGGQDLRYDPSRQMLITCTGMGTNRAANSIEALGYDPRFDLTNAYWVVAAVGGVDPNQASLGSAAWMSEVVDIDFAYAIDPRQIPKDWTTGYIPWGRTTPFEQPVPDADSNLFSTNKSLTNWAFDTTKSFLLPDNSDLQRARSAYTDFPRALEPPKVMLGDEATGQTFWGGSLWNRLAEQWVSYWTSGKGIFIMTAMEDSGILRALSSLSKAGKVAANRTLVLRTASNYSVEAPGQTPAEMRAADVNGFAAAALNSSLSAAYTVATAVIEKLIDGWDHYRDHTPES
jgi:purine nucleoside permease